MTIENGSILYFFSQPGCPHCSAARPIVNELRMKYIGRVLVLELNADNHPQIDDYKIKATPAYVVKRGGFITATHVGGATLAQLERLLERTGMERERAPRKSPRRAPARARQSPDAEERWAEGEQERYKEEGE